MILSTNTLRIIYSEQNIDLKQLLGILNSKLINYFFLLNYNNKDIYGYQLQSIPIAQSKNDNRLSTLVDKILEIKKQDPNADTTALESQIDQLVYELYELTEEEIAIVENSVN
jgi:hypothetical protein